MKKFATSDVVFTMTRRAKRIIVDDPALTDADVAADRAGTPRPDNPTEEATQWQLAHGMKPILTGRKHKHWTSRE